MSGRRARRGLPSRGRPCPCLLARLLGRGPIPPGLRPRRDRRDRRPVVARGGWRRWTMVSREVGSAGVGRKSRARRRASRSRGRESPPFGKLRGNRVEHRDAPCGIDRRDPLGDRSPRGLACTCPPKRRAQRAEASSAVRGARGGTLDCTPKGDGSRRVSEHIFRHR